MRTVDAEDGCSRRRDLGGQVAGAATQIKNGFARLRGQQFKKGSPVLPDKGVLIVVEFRVPHALILREGLLSPFADSRAVHSDHGADYFEQPDRMFFSVVAQIHSRIRPGFLFGGGY